MTLNLLDDPWMYLTKEFSLLRSTAFLDTWKVQPVYWIVDEKILPQIWMIEIVSCVNYERTRVKAYSTTYEVSLSYS